MVKSKPSLKNLFHPGTGRIPPCLTGRKQEQAYFRDCVDLLLDKTAPDQDMIVYGPRGNGKTAMLRYLQKETLSVHGNRLDIEWATPEKFATLEGLARTILGSKQKYLKKIKSLGISASVGFAGVQAELDVFTATAVTEDLLREKCRQKPLVLIVDEAHTLTSEIGRILLNASQSIRGDDCPFLLALAGTPNLKTALEQASATFWDKSMVFPLGRLAVNEAHQALRIPLESCQVTCAEGVLEEVAGRAHRYPYFIQIWGDCIANRLHETGVREVTMEAIREVEDAVVGKCATVYGLRYNELDRMDLVPLATDIGRMFAETDRKNIPREEFKKLVGQSLQEQGLSATNEVILENLRKLSHIGYIWEISVPIEVEGERGMLLCYEPGIPSLMQYVKNQSRSQADSRALHHQHRTL